MANLSEDIQCAGSDTRPPTLDRTDFASWQQWIRLYYRGKENGVNILKSIDEGSFQMGTLRETLTEGTEGALHLGPERPRVYSDLTSEEKDRMQLNSKFVNNMLPEWGRFVTVVKLKRGFKDSNYDQLYAYLKQHEGNNARGTGATGYEGAQNRVGYANPGQARQIKCYNYNGIRHLARNRTQPKRPQKLEYFKDKMLLMQAQKNGVALDEEQLLFIEGGQDNAVNEDVDEQLVHDLALNVDNVFQSVDCDTLYDEAGPSYDSDILSEVHDHDHYQDAVCEHHEVHEIHDDVQPNYGVDSLADYTSDNNMIPYDQYVKDNAVPVVQSNVSSVTNDAYMMILNDMHESPVQHVSVTTQNNIVDKSLTAELATYKEQVKLYERRARFELTKKEQKIDEQLRIVITKHTMADMNIPANDAPTEQAPAVAPPTRTDDQILPVEDVPVEEPAYNKEEENLQHALELSLKEQTERTQGPSRPVAIRKPDSGRIQPLLDVQGKGKKKVIDEQAALDLLTLLTPKNKSLTGPNPGDHDEGQDGPNPGVQDEGQARLNPGDAAESQPQSNEEFTTTSYPNVQENYKLPSEDSVIPEEPEEELGKTNAEAEVQSMVLVPIHQDTSLVSPMTTLVIYLTTSQSGSLLPTSTATTSVVMTTTTILPPPPQPQQSTTDPTLLKRIDELKQHMANLLQYNLAMEEMLDKHRSRLYKLENLNIPHHVSKAVDEIVTDAVDWAMQAPLQARFSDLPVVDMKETNSYQIWKKLAKRKERKVTYQELLLGLHRHNHTFTSSSRCIWCSSEAPSSSKFAASVPQSMAWTTSDTRYESAGISGTQELSPTDSLIQDDSIPDEQVYLSDDEDSENDHLPKAVLRKDWWKPLLEKERPVTPEPAWTIPSSTLSDTGDMTNFLNWYCRQVNKTMLTPADLEGKGSSLALSISKMKAASYPDFGLELFVPEQMWIDDKSDPPCGFSVSFELKPTPDMGMTIDFEDLNLLLLQGYLDYLLSSDKRMLSTAVKLWTRNLVIGKRVENFQLVVFSVNNNERKIMRFNEIYKFSDGTLTWILEALAYKVKEFKLKRLNPDFFREQNDIVIPFKRV
uniref:Retrovirus-related Pol polyprotein from transposon TNT 1-94 n=1 Tax=Tanacetum cinerariifolium TaxID=118510 RepID=A0A6L2LEL0_TANCI|nr:retrovirus-related Pol polyprotein from transposon TNT 1-94 [Tanacetum cinerariifolium]